MFLLHWETDTSVWKFLLPNFLLPTLTLACRRARASRSVFRIMIIFCPLYWTVVQFRKSVAKMPAPELSNFLCHDVLKAGIIATSPILYFTAEAFSCLLNTSDVSTCKITVLTSGYLSLYFVFYAFFGIAQASVSAKIRGSAEFIQRQISIAELVRLEMSFNKTVRVFLWAITAVLNIYLFAHIR